MLDMIENGVVVYCLPDTARCEADEEKKSPLELEECPIGCDVCTGDCEYYAE